jgi:antitoxin MazE
VKKRLKRIGNELGLILERPLLERLGINAQTELDVSTDGSVIVIAPKRLTGAQKKLKKVSDEIFERYAGAFKKLAD